MGGDKTGLYLAIGVGATAIAGGLFSRRRQNRYPGPMPFPGGGYGRGPGYGYDPYLMQGRGPGFYRERPLFVGPMNYPTSNPNVNSLLGNVNYLEDAFLPFGTMTPAPFVPGMPIPYRQQGYDSRYGMGGPEEMGPEGMFDIRGGDFAGPQDNQGWVNDYANQLNGVTAWASQMDAGANQMVSSLGIPNFSGVMGSAQFGNSVVAQARRLADQIMPQQQQK